MKRLVGSICVMLALLSAASAQQPAPQFAWDVKLSPDTSARSNLTVQNLCKKKHSFRITLENITFMRFQETEVSVAGRKTYDVPVVFDTARMSPGIYLGSVIVTCLTCRSEGTCTQDREVLAVRLQVTGQPGQPESVQTQPATTPPNTERPVEKPLCSDDLCEEPRARAWHSEDGAHAAKTTAEEVRAQADAFEQVARASEDAASRATASVENTGPGIVDEELKRSYPSNAFGPMTQIISQLFVELRSGKITTEQAQTKTEQLLNIDGIESVQDATSRNQAQQRYTANQATQNANQSRAAANGAQGTARAAQTIADKAQQDAQQARKNFENCNRSVAAGCNGLEREQQTATTPDRPESINILFNSPPATAAQPPANPCEQIRMDCERLRFEVTNLEGQLSQSQAVLDAARKEADRLEAEAQKADEAARRAAEAAKDTNSGRGRIIDESRGRVYTERDFALRRAAIRQIWSDYSAGTINAEQAQAAVQGLTGLDSLDRIQDEADRNLSARRYESQQVAKKAAEARAAANAARAAWQAAQSRVASLQQALQKARAGYEACLKKLKEACTRQQQEEARLAAERRRADEALARKKEAERSTREREARRPTAPAPQDNTEAAAEKRRRAREENKYLIDNIRALNMLPPASPEFDNFLAAFLAEDGGAAATLSQATPEFNSSLDAIYTQRARLSDGCNPSKAREDKLDQLQKMQNSRTGRLYTAGEAEVKLRNICNLLRKLKSRVESLPR